MDLPEDQRLKDISPKAYEHPADRAATAALQQIPMMDTVVRRLIEFGERSIMQQLLASAVRLGEDQLPDVWASHRAALARLDIEQIPDLYMWQMPFINAMAIGSKKPIVVLNSGTVEPDGRARAADRARRTRPATSCPTTCSTRRRCTSCCSSAPARCRALPFFAGLPLLAIRIALLEWFRAAELSCDRAADARHPQPDDDLPDDDGHVRAAPPRASSASTPSSSRPTSTWTGSRAGTS